MSASTSRDRVGVVGVGTMGGGMARNLLSSEFSVTVYDLRQENMDALVQLGASVGDSASDVVCKCDITLSSLPTSGTFVKVAEEILPNIKDGKLLIDAGTTEVPQTLRLARQIREQGADLVDAPVSGGGKGADEGSLAVMVGGSDESVARCLPILNAIGGSVGHLGDVGSGQIGKAVNQIAMGVAHAAFLEAMFLGVQAGLDPRKLWDTLSTAGAAKSSFQSAARQVITDRAHDQDCKLRELPYFIAQARAHNFQLPLTEALYKFSSAGENRTADPLGIPTPSFWHELTHRKRTA